MRIICQTILIKSHTSFLSKTGKDVAKFVLRCSRDWRFKGEKNNDQKAFEIRQNILDYQKLGIILTYKIIFKRIRLK